MKRIKSILSDKRGFGTFIELAVLIMVCLMMLTCAISYMNVYSRYNLVNAMAHEMARYVEFKGTIDSDTDAEFARLRNVFGFSSASVSFDKHGDLQLEEPFTVIVTVHEKWGIGSIEVFPVAIRAVATGRSEVYWK